MTCRVPTTINYNLTSKPNPMTIMRNAGSKSGKPGCHVPVCFSQQDIFYE